MNTITKISAIACATLLFAAPALALEVGGSAEVSAQTSVGGGTVAATVDAKIQVRMEKAKSHANQEIDRRVNKLNDLNTRVQAMVRISAAEKGAVATEVSSQISALTALKAKIDADTDIETLKTDIKSITGSYRIFVLIIPRGHIMVAADKVRTSTDLFTTFDVKLESRIAAAAAAGKDTTSLSASLTEMKAKLADANVQADAAVALVASLTPDNGDQAKLKANEQALKDARAKIKVALDDLHRARQDAHSIVQALHKMNLGANASASSTASGSVR